MATPIRTPEEIEQQEPQPQPVRVELSLPGMLSMVLVVTGVWVLIRLAPVVLMLIVALFIVGTLSSAVELLEARGIKRGTSIAIVFSSLLVTLLLISALTLPVFLEQVDNLIDQEPALRERVANILGRSRLTATLADALRNVHYDALLKSSATTLFEFSTRLIEGVAYGVGAIFLALYMMIDRDRLRGALFALVPRSRHIRLSRIMTNLQTIVGGYIRGQFITCALMTIFMFVLLTACGVSNALAIAVFGGLADMLPFIGVFLTMGPAVVAAYMVSPAVALIVLAVMLAYEELESRVLLPLVYGRALRLPSSVVLFSLVTGGTLMGVAGALLALPVAAAILMLIDELQVELPGEPEQVAEVKEREAERAQEYERRTEGLPVDQAAAIAVEISDKRKDEDMPPTPSSP